MTFRIILTVLMVIGTLRIISTIGEPREPYTVKDALLSMVISAAMIYGYWHWL